MTSEYVFPDKLLPASFLPETFCFSFNTQVHHSNIVGPTLTQQPKKKGTTVTTQTGVTVVFCLFCFVFLYPTLTVHTFGSFVRVIVRSAVGLAVAFERLVDAVLVG